MKNLNDKIKESGLQKSYIANKVGISSATLSRILSGKQSYVSEELLLKINEFIDSKK